MKKALSVLVALVMVLTLLVGCQGQPAQNDEKALAEKAVTNYMEALSSFEFGEAATYTTNPEKLMDSAPYAGQEDALEQMLENMPENIRQYETSLQKFVEAMFDVMQSQASYEIVSVDKKGDSFAAKVTLTIIDVDNFDSNSMMNEMMASIDIETLMMQMLEDGTINETMSEQELYDILFPALFDAMTDALDDVTMETTTTEQTFNIVKIDGKWLLDVNNF